MDRDSVRELLTELFEEEALLLGGVLAVNPASDDFTWRLVRGLDALRQRFLRRIDEAPGEHAGRCERSRIEPHPAIEHFLRVIREEAVAGA
jgi:hypothetical protein